MTLDSYHGNCYDAVIAPVDELFRDVVDYGTVAQDAIENMVGGLGKDDRLSDAAISKMVIDCLAIHGAVRDCCRCGWAAAAPMLLRTQVELLLGCAAISNGGNRAEFLAYKYYFLGTKSVLRQPGLPADKRDRLRDEACKFLEYLPKHQRQDARDFVEKGKLGSYWYSPDFKGPKDILKQHVAPEVLPLYQALSGAAHGGTLGIRLWRDIPDMEHPGPRRDPAAQSRAVTGSCVITMQAIHMRFLHQGLDSDPILRKLMEDNLRNREPVEALFVEANVKAREFINEHRRPGDDEERGASSAFT